MQEKIILCTEYAIKTHWKEKIVSATKTNITKKSTAADKKVKKKNPFSVAAKKNAFIFISHYQSKLSKRTKHKPTTINVGLVWNT